MVGFVTSPKVGLLVLTARSPDGDDRLQPLQSCRPHGGRQLTSSVRDAVRDGPDACQGRLKGAVGRLRKSLIGR
jgi:hypothetical protein